MCWSDRRGIAYTRILGAMAVADVSSLRLLITALCSEDVYEKAVHILEMYFDADDGEDQNLAPAMDAAHGQYTFGAAPAGQPGMGGFNFGGMPHPGAQPFNFQ